MGALEIERIVLRRLGKLRHSLLAKPSTIFHNGKFRTELDKVQSHIPEDVPDPSNANVPSGYRCDLSETPVTVGSNYGRD